MISLFCFLMYVFFSTIFRPGKKGSKWMLHVAFKVAVNKKDLIAAAAAATTHLAPHPPHRSKEPIGLNVWNTINLERSNRKGEIMVNKKDPVRGEAPVSHRAAAAAAGLDGGREGEGLFRMQGWG